MRNRLKGETRSDEQIRQHYDVEVGLANILKNATVEERKSENLYTKAYDEMFERVPDHPMLSRKESAEDTEYAIKWQMGLLRRFLDSNATVLEIGPGDCKVSFHLAKQVGKVVGVDVSNVITDADSVPGNFELIISDGTNIPVPDDSTDIVYSNQLMEHIHPDDAKTQLGEIFRVLRVGGNYICITPNRVNGPWDISYYFDDTASGFHLKEYTHDELVQIFREAGFRRFRAYVGAGGYYLRFPIWPLVLFEKLIASLPSNLRVRFGQWLPCRMLLGIKLVATK